VISSGCKAGWKDVRAVAMNKLLPRMGIETQPCVKNRETQDIIMLTFPTNDKNRQLKITLEMEVKSLLRNFGCQATRRHIPITVTLTLAVTSQADVHLIDPLSLLPYLRPPAAKY
jgi:hypothetical protein